MVFILPRYFTRYSIFYEDFNLLINLSVYSVVGNLPLRQVPRHHKKICVFPHNLQTGAARLNYYPIYGLIFYRDMRGVEFIL